MSSTESIKLRSDLLAIWRAGVDAVTPRSIFDAKVHLESGVLTAGDLEIDLTGVRRLVVVGAGKASAAMAIELMRRLQASQDQALLDRLQCVGWINCPEGTFDPNQDRLHLGAAKGPGVRLFAARPAGMNEPTEAAVLGTGHILDLVGSCQADDLVVCLLSGGGSALLTAPPEGISLADKQAVARRVSAAGGDIEQLNTVRRCLSRVKGGGLAKACRAGRLVSLVISDVLGDPLETIASGPTFTSATPRPGAALDVLQSLGLAGHTELASVVGYLKAAAAKIGSADGAAEGNCLPEHLDYAILGNNADAVDAAGVKAVELGYRYVMQSARAPEGDVMRLADSAAAAAQQLISQKAVDCWISGGEPTVILPAAAGKGGRNQQLTLAVMDKLVQAGWPGDAPGNRKLALVSGGTDGEDGPTDAAGAFFDEAVLAAAQQLGLNPESFLARADAYNYFAQAGGLVITGPTGTNVCDLRVALVR